MSREVEQQERHKMLRDAAARNIEDFCKSNGIECSLFEKEQRDEQNRPYRLLMIPSIVHAASIYIYGYRSFFTDCVGLSRRWFNRREVKSWIIQIFGEG